MEDLELGFRDIANICTGKNCLVACISRMFRCTGERTAITNSKVNVLQLFEQIPPSGFPRLLLAVKAAEEQSG